MDIVQATRRSGMSITPEVMWMHDGDWAEMVAAQRDWGTISVRTGNAKAKALRASRAKREAYERTIARTTRAWEANAERAWMRLREAAGYGGVMQ